MSEPTRQEIRLEITTPKKVGGGLAELIGQLEKVESYISRINQKMTGGMKISPELSRSYAQLKKEIEAFASKNPVKGAYSTDALAKALGLDPGMLATRVDQLRKLKEGLKEYRSQEREFTSVRSAVSGIHRALQLEVADIRKGGGGGLDRLLTPTVAHVNGIAVKGAETNAKVEGQIPLVIPATQVQASVSGPISLTIPGSQVAGNGVVAGNAVSRGPDGRFLPMPGASPSGTSATITRKKKSKAGPLDVPPQTGEFGRVRVESNDLVRETITRADALGQTISETWDNVEQAIVKTVKRRTTGAAPLEQFRTRRKLEEETFKQQRALLKDGDFFGLAKLQEKQASQIQNLLTTDLKSALGDKRSQQLQKVLDAQADTLRAQARESKERGRNTIQKQANKNFEAQKREQEKEVRFEEQDAARRLKNQRKRLENKHRDTDAYRHGNGPFFDEMAAAEDARAKRLEKSLQKNRLIHPRSRTRLEGAIEESRLNSEMFRGMARTPPPEPGGPKPSGEYARFLNALQGFTPMGFLANITKVTGWASAVTLLYKSLELATYSMHRFLDISQQTARLQQVFHGVGGSAQQLTDDVLKLADANGRSTEEAMESATEWSRLGLNRAEVNQAVQVSLMAANVSQMHAGETTKQLSSLMHIYGLEVHQLDGVLGMLVNTSQSYNVTLEDLFTGLDRAAGVARQAGMSLAELQGLIAATVGKTGQSGIIVGNTIKSILVQFSNPSMQKLLRSYGIETLTKAGQEKGGSQILRDLFVRYQSMGERERRNLTFSIAGRNQAARFVAMMDNYVQAQKLAIDAQLNLNSAQMANARILSTIKGQLAGLRAEWDRLMVSAGNRVGPVIEDLFRFGKNSLRYINEPSAPKDRNKRRLFGILPSMAEEDRFETEFGRKQAEYEKSLGGRKIGYWEWWRHSPDDRFDSWLKYREETPFERGGAAFANQLQEAHGKAMAGGLKARLFETIRDALPKANRPEAVKAMVEAAASEMDEGSAGVFRGAAKSGNSAAVRKLLDEQAGAAHRDSLNHLEAELKLRTERIAAGQAEAAQLQSEINELKKQGDAQDLVADKQGKLAEKQKELNQLAQEKESDLESLAAEATGTEQIIERKQEYINLLKEQEMLMQSLEQLSQAQGMDSATARLDAQVSALDTQVEALERAHKALSERGGEDDRRTAEDLRKQISEHEARRAALDSPQMRELAGLYDNRRIAARRAAEEAQSYGVGHTESDKLLNQERQLQNQLQGLYNKKLAAGLSDNETVRAKELEIQLWNTQERIQTRIVELARQERQIRLDAAREFNKGLLLAGPGELLQRLHTSELMRRPGGISPGEFMAMSPENRRLYFDAMGGEAGMINRMERSRMRGHRMSVEEEQAAQRNATTNVNFWDRALNANARGALNRLPPTTPLPLEARARLVADNLGNLAQVAALTTNTLGRMNQALDQFTRRLSGGHAAATSGPQLNISAGYSLGARS